MNLQIESTSLDDTAAIAERLAGLIQPGWVITLSGDLGVGKTQLVRGVMIALGSDDQVQSPSYTLERLYKTKNFMVHHYDFYRLQYPGLLKQELQEVISNGEVALIEWAAVVESVLSEQTRNIEITANSETGRILIFNNFSQQEEAQLQ